MLKGLFDSHAHYTSEKFTKEFEGGARGAIETSVREGVNYILLAAEDIENAKKCIKLAKEYTNENLRMYAACGIHPHEVGKIKDEKETIEKIKTLCKDEKVVAIGEIGLDFYYDFSDREVQKKWFEIQMSLAEELKLPVIIHDRDAHGACLDIVKKFPKVRGVFHSFSGSAEMARELIDFGYYISFSGVITFKNASRISEVVASVPLDRLLIETDCPYLAPEPKRGRCNISGYVKYTAIKAAEIKGIDPQTLADITAQNAKTLFRIEGEEL